MRAKIIEAIRSHFGTSESVHLQNLIDISVEKIADSILALPELAQGGEVTDEEIKAARKTFGTPQEKLAFDCALRLSTRPAQVKSRCCGRCDGVNDICHADRICEKHYEMGCEICFGARTTTPSAPVKPDVKLNLQEVEKLVQNQASLNCTNPFDYEQMLSSYRKLIGYSLSDLKTNGELRG